jgi:single-strand DNA-binding protein
MARSYNRIELIGNLTHDPEVRSTAKGAVVCSFRLDTDRSWTDARDGKSLSLVDWPTEAMRHQKEPISK